jgi:glucose-1-phosphate thymidylyltransferase
MSEFVGIIPAAGKARRLAGLQGSKEVVPVCALGIAKPTRDQARPACLYLMEAMRSAGINRQIMVLGKGKWDIPTALANADEGASACAYVVIADSPGVPWTIDAPYSLTQGFNVAMGFPDILTTQPDLFIQLCAKLVATDLDVVLGVFPTDQGYNADIVSLTCEGLVSQVTPKPRNVGAAQVWIAAVWRPSFTEYLRAYLTRADATLTHGRELYLGDIFNSSIAELRVGSVEFSAGRFLDIGTPSNLDVVRPS